MSRHSLISQHLVVFSPWSRSRCAIALIGLGLIGSHNLAFGQPPANANQPAFREAPFKFDEKASKEKKRIKDDMLKTPATFSKQVVADYYKGYLFAQLTSLAEPELANKARVEIYEDIDKAEKAGDSVMSELNALLMEDMPRIVEGPFQPSATIVATQILGRLNESRGSSSQPPVPYKKATLKLFEYWRSGKNDGIRAAALTGFERHVDLLQGAWDDRTKQGIADALFASLQAPKPANRSARSDAWLRGRSIDLLLKIKHAKDAELYQYAMNTLANPKSDPILLEKAMLVTGQYPSTQVAPEIAKQTLSNTMKYLVRKLKILRDEVGKEQHEGSSSGGSGPMAAMAASDAAPAGEEFGAEDGMGKKAKKKAAEPKSNPFAKQSIDVINKRRALHELLENVRYGYTGSKFGVLTVDAKTGLALQATEGDGRQIVGEVMVLLKDLQDAINSPSISDRKSLFNEAEPKIDALLSAAEFFLTSIGEAIPTPAPTEGTDAVDTTVAADAADAGTDAK